MHIKFFLLLPFLFSVTGVLDAQTKRIDKIYSPDKRTICEVGIGANKRIMYNVIYGGKRIIEWSALGFVLNNERIGDDVIIKGKWRKSVNEKFAWRLGENDTVLKVYNEAYLNVVADGVPFAITLRVFDGSVAFRYEIPAPMHSTVSGITREDTQFNFPGMFTLYQYNQESVFTPVSIDTFSKTCDFPATLTNGNYFVSIGEAVNTSYTKGELKKSAIPHGLLVAFVNDTIVNFRDTLISPWRTISISKTAIGLHKFSELNLKLSEPTENNLPDWIKPGKLIRAQLNTKSALNCIDFAVKHRFQYIMFDAGWYGAEFRSSSDPTQVIPAIDMKKVIDYGNDRNVGLILYVNYVGLKAKLDTILPLFRQWGVKGIKFGFVDGLSQEGITWLTKAIEKVNQYGFILDIHDNYKPTGVSRTFPALLTQEGIRGDENSPDAFHTTVLPFTRFLAGPADFTFCFPNPANNYSKNLKVTKAQQYALSIIYFSPLQSIFWYGRPEEYINESEIEFFNVVPTVWNESKYLTGDIGKNISVARRNGTTWFVGNAAGLKDWKGSIKLDFLTKGKSYHAVIYEDDNLGGVRKRTLSVKREDHFAIDIKAAGGQALIIEEKSGFH